MNTSDPQAPYTVKLNGPIETSATPLKVFDVVRTTDGHMAMVKEIAAHNGSASLMYLHEVPPGVLYAWWNPKDLEVLLNVAKIASGELMVVKSARLLDGRVCDNCGICWPMGAIPVVGDHCYCGAKIIEG